MANTGGKNGAVAVTTNATGSTVVVSYPYLDGPPVQNAHDDVFDPCSDPWLRAFQAALPVKVDVVAAGASNVPPTSVTAHK